MGTADSRRLIAHEDLYEALLGSLRSAYISVPIGDPREETTLVGPLIDRRAYELMQQALDESRDLGAVVTGGERSLVERFPDAYYVRPRSSRSPNRRRSCSGKLSRPFST